MSTVLAIIEPGQLDNNHERLPLDSLCPARCWHFCCKNLRETDSDPVFGGPHSLLDEAIEAAEGATYGD